MKAKRRIGWWRWPRFGMGREPYWVRQFLTRPTAPPRARPIDPGTIDLEAVERHWYEMNRNPR